MRVDMISPRPLRPAKAYPSISHMTAEARPVPDVIITPIHSGQINGVMPGCRAAPPPKAPQPALVLAVESMNKSLNELDIFSVLMKSEEGYKGPDVSSDAHVLASHEAHAHVLKQDIVNHAFSGRAKEAKETRGVLKNVENRISKFNKQGIKTTPQTHAEVHEHYKQNSEHYTSPMSQRLQSAHKDLSKQSGGETVVGKRSVLRPVGQPQAKPKASMWSHTGGPSLPSMTHTPVSGPQLQRSMFDEMMDLVKGENVNKILPALMAAGSAIGAVGSALNAVSSAANPSVNEGKAVKSEDFGKPLPSREKGQSTNEWMSNMISKLVKEGHPQKQAVAIAYSKAGLSQTKKSMKLILPLPKHKYNDDEDEDEEDKPRLILVLGQPAPNQVLD